MDDRQKAEQTRAKALEKEKQWNNWRAELKPGTESYVNLERALSHNLKVCEDLHTLKSVWQVTYRALTAHKPMLLRLKEVKDCRKAELEAAVKAESEVEQQ